MKRMKLILSSTIIIGALSWTLIGSNFMSILVLLMGGFYLKKNKINMSDSKIQKGRKSSKKDNLASNLDHRKHVPYGSIKGSHIQTDEGVVNEVNKKHERQNAKKEIRKELDED